MNPVLIFDLDGTLADSEGDLAAAVNYVREQHELPPLPVTQIRTYIGGGAQELIRRALEPGATSEQIHSATKLFLHYYRQHMLDSTVLYPGVHQTLDRLQDYRLAVLTNKPVYFSISMLVGLGIYRYFSAVYGGNSFQNKKPDPAGIFQILSNVRGRRETCWMIGDSSVDVMTGRNAGVITCGVTYGYGRQSLESLPPDFAIDHFSELEKLVRRQSAG